MPIRREETTTTDDGLAEFGYAQKLERSLGGFATFAAGVSFISILTGCFQLFYFGYGFAGPAYWWTWPIVFVGQLMVALCFAELAARYPVAGSVYNWSKRLGSPAGSWFAGWSLLFGQLFSMAGAALALQITLPQIWSGFQVVGDGSTPSDFALNGVLLGSALIVATTLINAFGVKLMGRVNSVGVAVELVASVTLIVLLALHVRQPISVLFDTERAGEGSPLGYLGAFLVASLATGFVMFGFDTASSLGEEAKDPKRGSPVAILRAINASFFLGGSILLLGILSARDPSDKRIGSGAGGLQFLVLDALGPVAGTALLCCVAVAVCVCVLAIHTASIRSVFAMARDGGLPFSASLARVNQKSRTPVVPAIVIGLGAIVILLVNVGQPEVFTTVTSVAVVLVYVAYLLVTIPMLVQRIRGGWSGRDNGPGYFSLGRLGIPVNVIAVVWGFLMALNLVWPRSEIYGSVPWAGVVACAGIGTVGVIVYVVRTRRGVGVLAEHRSDPAQAHAASSSADRVVPPR
ncbi:APC family permease [uncultured Amnibacterium sp.]|uniref:APC family permease n=1 Tax=uncultured Amnibacterium sp. TaxID=1631851 RepID=UPI0035C99E26